MSESHIHEEIVAVVPETYYFFKVYAKNQEGKNGAKRTVYMQAPAGVPYNEFETESRRVIPSAPVVNKTTVTIVVKRDFLYQTRNGQIRLTGLIGCEHSKCKNIGSSISKAAFETMKTYSQASKEGFTPYRITNNDWENVGRRRRRDVTDEITYTVGTDICDAKASTYCNGPLPPDTAFSFIVVTCTNGGCLLSDVYGPYKTEKGVESNQGDAPTGPIVGGVMGGIFVLAVIGATIGFVIYRKRKMGPNSLWKLWKHESLNNGYNEDRLDTPRKRPVKLSEFSTYVADMHEDLNLKFSLSFEDLKALSLNHKQSVATETKNQTKNRDMHVQPYDHSRVVLRSEHGMDDYINASFLPGYRSAREYIGCQGPLPGTVDDFWRMVWEQNVSAVVMLTLCQEHNEVKCEQYWPSVINEPKQFGDVEVQLISSSSFANYNHNVMKLVCNGRPRILEHFQFLSWRNMTTNDALIDFITQVRKHVQPPDTAGPMIVHCSNGAGRTGIYIMLDHLMQFIDDHDFGSSIDIFGMVLKLQENRPNIVQTLHQYEFIHDCINTILARKDTASSQGNTYETIKSSERYAYQNQQEHAYEMLKLN